MSSSVSSSTTTHETCTRYRDRAVGKLFRLIAFKTLAPLMVLAWTTTQSWSMVALSVAFMPLAVLIQSVVGLTLFRITNGVPPIPITPRHGVVVVHPEDIQQSDNHQPSNDHKNMEEDDNDEDFDHDLFYEFPFDRTTVKSDHKGFLKEQSQKRPLRLLVVGDSLAIGVGQNHWPTPIMPETIAKTLSRKMGGRAVYWTCHGATGASIGWVIRELERGVHYLNENDNNDNNKSGAKIPSSCNSTVSDESGSEPDEELNTNRGQGTPLATDGLVQGDESLPDVSEWRKRLHRHRKRFEPDLSGFYDIVVFVTGPNDAKSALLPFLLTGEDGELRKQAQQRGSSFTHDLHLLLETLARKMRLRVQILRQRVEAAADSVLESLHLSSSPTASSQQRPQPAPREFASQKEADDNDHDHHNDPSHNQHGHPLVVFPGLPNNALPVFQNVPIVWYGGPPISFYGPTAIDILDAHKHDIACTYPDDIAFVPAPTKAQATDYILRKGHYFDARHSENTLLSVRDISSQESKAQEERLRSYYQSKGKSAYMGSPFRSLRSFLGMPIPVYFKGSAVDGVHPNEIGYDFWGRYLGEAIYDKWQKREARRLTRDKKAN